MAEHETDAAKVAQDAFERAGRRETAGDAHMVLLVDETGSMDGLNESVVTGVNEFIHRARSEPRTRVWVGLFDKHPGEPRLRWWVKNAPAVNVRDFGPVDYAPRGMTPLFDATLETIEAVMGVAKPEDGVFVAIITDGKENASEASQATVSVAVQARESKGWAFAYIGANVNAQEQAAALGLKKRGSFFNFNATRVGTERAFAGASGQSVSYASSLRSTGSAVAAQGQTYAVGEKLGDRIPEGDFMPAEDAIDIATQAEREDEPGRKS